MIQLTFKGKLLLEITSEYEWFSPEAINTHISEQIDILHRVDTEIVGLVNSEQHKEHGKDHQYE